MSPHRSAVALFVLFYVISPVEAIKISQGSRWAHSKPRPGSNSRAMTTASTAGIIIKDTGRFGLGAYAGVHISEGKLLGEYEGEALDQRSVDARYWKTSTWTPEDSAWLANRQSRGVSSTGDYLFAPTEDCYIDGEDWDKANWTRYMNHAAESESGNNVNVIFSKVPARIWFAAKRDIEIGEQLCYSYGGEYFKPDE